jgi:hypothetical protein
MPTHLLPVAVVGCAFALAACASAGKPTASVGSKNFASFLSFSECMRARGVPNFPDPPAGGGIHVTPSSGIDPESPAFQAAQQTCRKLLPGGGPPRNVPESVKLQLLNHAECMRAHGVPNYPDPTFPAGGGVESFFPSSVEFGSPVFQSALKACGGRE